MSTPLPPNARGFESSRPPAKISLAGSAGAAHSSGIRHGRGPRSAIRSNDAGVTMAAHGIRGLGSTALVARPAVVVALSVALSLAAPRIAAALPSPTGVSAVAGCQQYTLSWNAVEQAAAYRVYVVAPPETMLVQPVGATIAVNSTPTLREFQVASIDSLGQEGTLSSSYSATGAEAAPPQLQPLAEITVHVGDPLTVMASLVGQPGVPAPLTSFTWWREVNAWAHGCHPLHLHLPVFGFRIVRGQGSRALL